jgi:ribosomal protein L12E/L44/L45/RPP1/RPP2
MNRIQRVIADEASEAFWDAFVRALELNDLRSLIGAARELQLASPAAASAIAVIIETGEEREKALPIIRWLVAALKGQVGAQLH